MKNLFFLALCILIGCRENDVEDVNNRSTSAGFDFDQIQVVSFQTRSSRADWPDLKDKAIVSLRTCIVDAQYLEPIVGEDFKLKSQFTNQERSTNSNGCLSWVEEFDYNYLSHEAFIEVNGEITGLDNFKGRKTYSLGLNPWERRGSDLSFSRIDNLSDIKALHSVHSQMKNIEATRFNVAVLEKTFSQNKTRLKLDISTTPELIRNGLDGNLIKEPLTGGVFNVEYLLIERRTDSNERSVIAESRKEVVVRDDGFLNSLVEFELNTGINPNSQIELGVKITAKGVDLGSDEGVVSLNRLDGTITGDLIDIPVPFSLIATQKFAFSNSEENELGFVIDRVGITRGSEAGANLASSNSHSSVDSIFELRIVDPLIHQEIKNHTFTVEVIDKETNENLFLKEVSSLAGSGLIRFRSNIPYRRYNTRRWKEYILRVSSNKSPYVNILKERTVFINPWLNTADFGIDSAVGTPPTVDGQNQPEIYIDEFSFRFIGNKSNSYRLNKNLDLKYDKKLRVEFRPKLKVSHDYDGGRLAYEKIINGKYKLRMLVLAPKNQKTFDATRDVELDDYYTLTAGETTVQVSNGLVSGDIDLPLLFTDQIVYATKNLALIELRSLEEDVELLPGYFVGMFSGHKKSGVVKNAAANSMRLSTGNVDIAQTLIAKISHVKKKLDEMRTDIDFFSDFTKKLRNILPHRQVFNHDRFRLEKKKSSIGIYPTEIAFRKLKEIKSSTDTIKSMIIDPKRTSQNLLTELCATMFDKNKVTIETHIYPSSGYGYTPPTKFEEKGVDYKKCVAKPFDFISFTKLDHVNEIIEQPENAFVESMSLARSVAYFISRGQNFMESSGVRESEYFQHGWHVGAGLELTKWGFFGGASYGADGGHRTDLYTIESDSEILSNQKRIINQDGLTMAYDRFDLSFKANVKSCVLITGKDVEVELPQKYTHHTLFDIFRKKDIPKGKIASPKRLYVCAQNGRELEKHESWYFVRADKKSTMGDESLSRNSMINVIRGEKNFEGFRRLQVETDKALIIHENDKSTVTTQYQNYLGNRGGNISYKDRLGVGFPGLLE